MKKPSLDDKTAARLFASAFAVITPGFYAIPIFLLSMKSWPLTAMTYFFVALAIASYMSVVWNVPRLARRIGTTIGCLGAAAVIALVIINLFS